MTIRSLSFDVGKDGVIVFKFPNKFYINLLKGAIYAGEIFIFSVFTRDAGGENTPNHCKHRWFRRGEETHRGGVNRAVNISLNIPGAHQMKQFWYRFHVSRRVKGCR